MFESSKMSSGSENGLSQYMGGVSTGRVLSFCFKGIMKSLSPTPALRGRGS